MTKLLGDEIELKMDRTIELASDTRKDCERYHPDDTYVKVMALLVNAEIEIEKLPPGNRKTYLILYAINKLAALSKVA